MTFWKKISPLISLGDLLDLRELGGSAWQRIFRRLQISHEERVAAAWAHVTAAPKNWWEIPAVRRRWNRLITGEETLTPVQWVCRRWLTEKEYVAFSPGCGTGYRELQWAATGKFRQIIAIDLSSPRIRFAQNRAQTMGLSNVTQFRVGNIFHQSFPQNTFDVIIVEDALHHFAPVKVAIQRLHHWLKPGGWIIVNEFVGPSRFQWSDLQLKLANAALQLLPDPYRRLYRSGRIKKRIYRPGLLRMWLQDPSEAVESHLILPTLHQYFSMETVRGYGGTLLALVLNGIAQHFVDDDPQALHWLSLLFGIEDYFIRQGILPHDYVFAVGRKITS